MDRRTAGGPRIRSAALRSHPRPYPTRTRRGHRCARSVPVLQVTQHWDDEQGRGRLDILALHEVRSDLERVATAARTTRAVQPVRLVPGRDLVTTRGYPLNSTIARQRNNRPRSYSLSSN